MDAFLDFLLKGLLEELPSFGEKEFFGIVEKLSVGGLVADLVAFVEQGIETLVKEGSDFGGGTRGGFRLHNNTSL
jgi:hypothetical protein